MSIRIGRTLPPAAAPISFMDISHGVKAMLSGVRAVHKFTEELKSHFKVDYCFLLSSGKAALVLILEGLKILAPDRNEVLIPAYTCYSVPSAIIRAGLKVRICDIEPETLDFDYDELEKQLSNPRLLCVLPTHLFGIVSDVPKLRGLIGDRNIFIVEDAAQAMGAELNGDMVGTLGDVSFLSLGRGKVITAVEGGIILTSSARIGNAISSQFDSIAGYGIIYQFKLFVYAIALSILVRPEFFWIPKMLPFLRLGETHFDSGFKINKLSNFQAGLVNGWKEKIARLREIRKSNSEKYSEFTVRSPLGSANSGVIRFPYYLLRKDAKINIIEKSSMLGLGISDVYPETIDCIEEIRHLLVGGKSAKAKQIAATVITLPVHQYVNNADIAAIRSLLSASGE